jgi:oligopeptide/dipeptide ABC transporter ATP-binding protein
VMYLGRIVEIGPADEILSRPAHPYTRALLDAVPHVDPDQATRPRPLSGDVPSALNLPAGCAFRPRCVLADGRCAERPPLERLTTGRRVACFHARRVLEGIDQERGPQSATSEEAAR